MNIATSLLEAPVEKTASGITEALQQAGEMLAKYKGSTGLAGGLLPLESYALSAGLGAGAQQAVNRTLSNRLGANSKMLKALELGSAAAVGGGSGLAGALAAPLSSTIRGTTGVDAARRLAELTAMGTGAEMALSPIVSGLRGAGTDATNTLAKLLGGSGIALGGRVAADMREIGAIRNMIATGGGKHLPKAMRDPKFLGASASDIIKARLGSIPQGGLLGAAGLGLAATGNPFLAAGAGLTGALKYTTPKGQSFGKYLGDIGTELTAKKKTKDAIDGLYKKSSVNSRLVAPVFMTSPSYILDAPTLEKVGNLVEGVGKVLSKVRRQPIPGGAALVRNTIQKGSPDVKFVNSPQLQQRRMRYLKSRGKPGQKTNPYDLVRKSKKPRRAQSTGAQTPAAHQPVAPKGTTPELQKVRDSRRGSTNRTVTDRARDGVRAPGSPVAQTSAVQQPAPTNFADFAAQDGSAVYNAEALGLGTGSKATKMQAPVVSDAQRAAQEANLTQGTYAQPSYPHLQGGQAPAPRPAQPQMPSFQAPQGPGAITELPAMANLRDSITSGARRAAEQAKQLGQRAVDQGRKAVDRGRQAVRDVGRKIEGDLTKGTAEARAQAKAQAQAAQAQVRDVAYDSSFVGKGGLPQSPPSPHQNYSGSYYTGLEAKRPPKLNKTSPVRTTRTPEPTRGQSVTLKDQMGDSAAVAPRVQNPAEVTRAVEAPVARQQSPLDPMLAQETNRAKRLRIQEQARAVQDNARTRRSINDATANQRANLQASAQQRSRQPASITEATGVTEPTSRLNPAVAEPTTLPLSARQRAAIEAQKPVTPRSGRSFTPESSPVRANPSPSDWTFATPVSDIVNRSSIARSSGSEASNLVAPIRQRGSSQAAAKTLVEDTSPTLIQDTSPTVFEGTGRMGSRRPAGQRPARRTPTPQSTSQSERPLVIRGNQPQPANQPRYGRRRPDTPPPVKDITTQELDEMASLDYPALFGSSQSQPLSLKAPVKTPSVSQPTPSLKPAVAEQPQAAAKTLVEDTSPTLIDNTAPTVIPGSKSRQSLTSTMGGGKPTAPPVQAQQAPQVPPYKPQGPQAPPVQAPPVQAPPVQAPQALTTPASFPSPQPRASNLTPPVQGPSAQTVQAPTVQAPTVQAPTAVPGASPLAPPVQAPTAVQGFAPNINPTESANIVSGAAAKQQGGISGVARMPELSLNRQAFRSDQTAGIEILNARGTGQSQVGKELAETLEAVEGAGGLRGAGGPGSLRKSVQATQEEAMRNANVTTYAKANNDAVRKLTGANSIGGPDGALLNRSIMDVSAETTELTAANVLEKMNNHPSTFNHGVTKTQIEKLLGTTQGKAVMKTQEDLAISVAQYESALSTDLTRRLEGMGQAQSAELSKTIENALKPRGGVFGVGAQNVSAAEQEVVGNIGKLVEARADLVTKDLSLMGQRQAAEVKRIANEVIKSGNPQAMKDLETALAQPTFEFSSVGAQSPLASFLNTESRNLSFGMGTTQATEFSKMVGLEGRGMGDVAKQTREFFGGQALSSPNSPAGRELGSVMKEMGQEGEQLLAVGRQGGPAGESAFGKIMSGDPALARAEGYSIAELEALGGDVQTHINDARNLIKDPGAIAMYEERVVNARGSIGDALQSIDTQIAKLQRQLSSKSGRAATNLNNQINQLDQVRLAAVSLRDTQQVALQPQFSLGEQAVNRARGLISKDFRIGQINIPGAEAAEAAGAAGQKGMGTAGTLATVGGTAGLAALLAGRGASTPATKAREEMMARASFGLSPLHAPVAYIKKTAYSALDAPVATNKPPKLEQFKPISPDKIPAQSSMTATVGAMEQAMKQSSLLYPPVRGSYHGHV